MSDRCYWERRGGYAGADRPSARAFADPKAAQIAVALDLDGDEPILDVGAGTGHLTAAFRRRGHPVVAIDLAQAMLVRNPAERTLRGDAARLPFCDGAFPLVVEANVLHHVPDPVAVLREMARVTSSAVACVEPNRNHPPMFAFSLIAPEERAGLRFTLRHLRGLAREAGLDPIRLVATGWVYQNRTPTLLAPLLGRWNGPCPLAAYLLGIFRKETIV